MTTDFIHAFRRMHIHEREQALKLLATELSPYEWRALHAMTGSRTFQFDVIGQLPVELVAQIFSHLDVAAPYRLQSVSRRWNHTLKSLHVLKASLNQWYEGTVNFQDADYALCRKKASKIHAFRTGKPRNVYKITPKIRIDDIYLAGNKLVWKQPATSESGRTTEPELSRSVCVLDLATWHLRRLRGQGRERIINVHVSNEIVALTTWASICYVHELQGKRGCKKFRVPNINLFYNVSCRGRTVACVNINKHRTAVFIWEYDSQRGRSFEIKPEPSNIYGRTDAAMDETRTLAPIIQPATQTIIIFARAIHAVERPPDQLLFAFSRYTYSGECLSTHYLSIPGIFGIESWSDPNSFVPVDCKETVLAIRMQDYKDPDTRELWAQGQVRSSFLLRFNEEKNDLRIWEGSRLSGGGSMAWWKDTCYGALWDEKADQRDVIAHMGTSDDKLCTPIVSEPKDSPPAPYERLNIAAPIVLNEKYVVRNEVDDFYILCFDDDDQGKWPKESGPFFDLGQLEVLKAADS